MAHLDSRTTSGEHAWDKYIKSNKDFRQMELLVEKGVRPFPLLVKSGSKTVADTKVTLKPGDKFKITKNTVVLIGAEKHAEVSIRGKIGLVSLKNIRKPSKAGLVGTTGAEEKAISGLDSLIKKNKRPITILVKEKNKIVYRIENVVGARKTPGTPKSDFSFYDNKGKDVFWISHKDGSKASDFQQWSGVTDNAGEVISNHPLVKKFLRAVSANIRKEQLIAPMYMKIKDKKLALFAVYGPEYGKKHGIDFVQIAAQGNPILTPVKSKRGDEEFELTFSAGIHVAGHVPDADYTPVLGATFRAGRGFDLDGKRYVGARPGIMPYALMKTRNGLVEVK